MSVLLKYKYIFFTLLLIFVLGIPFYLKQKDARLEIFPAIIFPSGAGLVKLDKEWKSSSLEIWIFKNSWKKITVEDFLDEIPPWFIYTLTDRKFGLKPLNEQFRVSHIPFTFNFGEIYSNEKNDNQVRVWLRKKLEAQGATKMIFKIKRLNIVFNKKMQIQRKELVNETFIDVSQ